MAPSSSGPGHSVLNARTPVRTRLEPLLGMIRISVCLLLILFFVIPFGVFAEGNKPVEFSQGKVNESLAKIVPLRILPGNPFYFLITIKETVERMFQPSSEKRARFDFVLSGKRLKEAYLLSEKGAFKNASWDLLRYSGRIDKMIGQIEKARSQNQDVSNLVSVIADGLGAHEILFLAIDNKSKKVNDYNFGDNYKKAVKSLVQAINAINDVRPGLKDRFKIATSSAEPSTARPSPSPEPSSTFFEALPSEKPRRIIY